MPESTDAQRIVIALAVIVFAGSALVRLEYGDLFSPSLKPLPPQSVQEYRVTSTGAIPDAIPPVAMEGATSSASEPGHPPQFVVLAFDGSRSIQMWKDTRQFAREMALQGKPVSFTYFISGVYLLEDRFKNEYVPPRHSTGTSEIGYADNRAKDISDRLEQINLARAEGHEIGSHLNGHFNGSSWSAADWTQEFDQFDHLIDRVATLNQIPESEPEVRRGMIGSSQGIVGLRAPELGVSPGLWHVLKERGYRYDASRIGKAAAWPQKTPFGFWEMPLAKIPYATTTHSILSMDYNFYFTQSKAKDVTQKGSPEWDQFFDDMLLSYTKYFNMNYTTSRAPVFIGHHFSLWNDGVYWEAMKRFASDVCGKPDVRCVTYAQLAEYLDQHGTDVTSSAAVTPVIKNDAPGTPEKQ